MKNKIYKDGERAIGKECAGCKTKIGVFYDKKSDFFLCSECEYELNGDNKNEGK